MSSTGGIVAGVLVATTAVVLLAVLLKIGIKVVKEKEVIVVERLGKFHNLLVAGIHGIVPFIDRPKKYWYRYQAVETNGAAKVIEKKNVTVISTQNEVLDFPKQNVITRDNASIYLDAVLSYKIVNPKTMIYTSINLPMMLSKLLQASLRNVAGTLELDQIIEESASLNVLTGTLDQEASRWGVKIQFVKVQRVEAPALSDVLAAKKNADLKNQEVIIGAKAAKQTRVIESEGLRDSKIRRAEGEAAEVVARARGEAAAIVNRARAEERSIREISRAISKYGDNPAQYLLALKYIDALRTIVSMKDTKVRFFPDRSAFVQTLRELGLNTVVPRATA